MDETTTEVAASEPVLGAPTFPPGTTLREYETIFALKPELADEAVDRFKERVRSLIHREQGKAIKFTVWGKKKTQYELERQNRATYVHVDYLGQGGLVAEIERNLRMSDDVVRYQTVKLGDEVSADKPVEQDLKLAGDADQPERPPREERERREEFGGDGGGEGEEFESA